MTGCPGLVKVVQKPIEEEAVQFDGSAVCASEILAWIRSGCEWSHGHFRPSLCGKAGALFVPVRFGVMQCDPGDWVIRDGNEFRACHRATFAQSYEIAV